ncbi:MAG: class I SAM-dependent methyltransferase [Calditrichia bacterium]|nr:class I SAM-dependent methyltransferase [Calditrichia bacterium]
MNNSNLQYPKIFARFYDLIYHQIRNGVDNDFFLQKINQTEGKVLEIGVGTGRFYMDALNQGADIYGIDVSPEMMKVLKNKLEKKHFNRISIQDIVDFNFDFKFDLIIAPFRVLMHILNKKDQLKALNNIYHHLNTGGHFIFDTFIPDLNYLIKGLDNQVDFEGEYEPGKKVKRIVSTQPDLIEQLINITFKFVWDEDNMELENEWKMQLRFFFRFELEHLIERSEFESYKILGDYQENELSTNSKEFIMICDKQ